MLYKISPRLIYAGTLLMSSVTFSLLFCLFFVHSVNKCILRLFAVTFSVAFYMQSFVNKLNILWRLWADRFHQGKHLIPFKTVMKLTDLNSHVENCIFNHFFQQKIKSVWSSSVKLYWSLSFSAPAGFPVRVTRICPICQWEAGCTLDRSPVHHRENTYYYCDSVEGPFVVRPHLANHWSCFAFKDIATLFA